MQILLYGGKDFPDSLNTGTVYRYCTSLNALLYS